MSQDCNQVIHLHYCRGVTGAKQNGAGELLEPTICDMRSIVFRPVEGAVGFFDFLIFFSHTKKRLRLRRPPDGQVGRLRWFWTHEPVIRTDMKKKVCFTYVHVVASLGRSLAQGASK